MADQVNRNMGRRKFFNRVGIGTMALGFLSSFPVKLFAKVNKDKNVKVIIHPSAVKRTK